MAELFYRAAFKILKGKSYDFFAKEGLNKEKKNIILSFDCDTLKDIDVIPKLNQWLIDRGIKAVYAVPAELLIQGKSVYQQVCNRGSEFINHGYLSHSALVDGKYISTVYYHLLSYDQVKEDIQKGHAAIVETIGYTPKGFRTPHFGLYQSPEQLSFLYKTLSDMGYQFSTSTSPIWNFKKGNLFYTANGLIEFPVSGCFDYPKQILDSYSFRFAAGRVLREEDYYDQFKKLLDNFSETDKPLLLNFYADPSQVYDFDGFYKAIEYALAKGFIFKSYEQVINSSIHSK